MNSKTDVNEIEGKSVSEQGAIATSDGSDTESTNISEPEPEEKEHSKNQNRKEDDDHEPAKTT